MNINSPTTGKILIHGKGAGGTTGDDVETRARELAMIKGRSPESVNDSDRAEARAEMDGRAVPDTTGDDVEGVAGMIRDPSEPPSVTGHQTTNWEGADEQKAVERLVNEGVEEAQHDQMLASRRAERRQERG
jgi:hypothetical protein